MPSNFHVQGADELEHLGRALKASGDKQLKRELMAGIRKSAKSTIRQIRESARADLPSGGGLNEVVARSQYGIRTRLSGKSVGVEIRATSRSVKSLRALNEGRLRHPVWGNRDAWVTQTVRPSWFSNPIQRDLSQIRAGIAQSMEDAAQKIARSTQ